MITNAYRVTLLIASEHQDGKLPPTGSNSVTDFIHMALSGDGGMSWDHPPEYELVEVAEPGSWSTVPGGPVFAFHEKRCAELVRASTGDASTIRESIDRVAIEPIDHYEDSPDTLDSALSVALEHGAITSALPDTRLSVYPLGSEDESPVLAVIPAEPNTPNLLDPHEWDWPDDELGPVDFTVAVIRWVVERANQLYAEMERHNGGRGELDHTYTGIGVRLTKRAEDPGEAMPGFIEQITGAFRVLCWLPNGGAVVGNGENPETIWATKTAPERVA